MSNPNNVSYSILINFYFYKNAKGFLISYPHIFLIFWRNDVISEWGKTSLWNWLILPSQIMMINVFIFWLTIFMSLLGKYLFRSIAYILSYLDSVSYWTFGMEITPLSDVQLTNIFSHVFTEEFLLLFPMLLRFCPKISCSFCYEASINVYF